MRKNYTIFELKCVKLKPEEEKISYPAIVRLNYAILNEKTR